MNIRGDYWVSQPERKEFARLRNYPQLRIDDSRKRLQSFQKHSGFEWTETECEWKRGRLVVVKTVEQRAVWDKADPHMEIVTTEWKRGRMVVTKRERRKEAT